MKIFNIGLPNKKASLNLSINAIVIVVLAMTLLGLGLGFIRNMFKDISSTTSDVTEQIRSQILEDLRTGNKKLSFPSTEISVEKGEAKIIAFGVKNTRASGDMTFTILPNILQAQKAGATIVETEDITDVSFFYDPTPKTLGVTDADVYTVRLTASGSKGVYMTKIIVCETSEEATDTTVCDSANIYAEKTFFINVI